MADIEAIVDATRQPIPDLVKPTAPAKSWRTLKPGQVIVNTLRVCQTGNDVDAPAGSLWYVAAVDRTGAELALLHVSKRGSVRLEYQYWDRLFVRVRKPTKTSPLRERYDELDASRS